MSSNLTEQELAKMQAAKSESEWNQACDLVKRARGGSYPEDWFPKIILSGLASKVQVSWGRS
jgi:hypothetical protein